MRRMGTARLWPLFLNQALRAVAIYWLAFFSSIFVYRQFSLVLEPRLALAGAFLFWGVFGLAKLLATGLAENLSLKLGLKAQMSLGMVLMLAGLGCFWLSLRHWFFLLPAVGFWGLSSGAYWFGWYGEVGKLNRVGKYGRTLGAAEVLMGAVNVLAPISGGLLIYYRGYGGLFAAACFLTGLGMLALWPLKGEKTRHDATLKEVLGLFATHKQAFLTYFSLGALGTIGASSFVLYLAFILKGELALGEFFSASLLLVAVIKLGIGRLIDLGKEKRIIFLGSWGQAGVWVGRLLTANPGVLLGLNVVYDLASSMVGMPLGVLSLKKGIDGRNMGRALLFREMAISLGYAVIALILAVLAWQGWPLTAGFLLAVPLSLVPILIYGKKKK